MNEMPFDQVTKALAVTRSRRGALRLLAGSALALLGTNAQAASNRRRTTRQQPRCVPAGKYFTRKPGRRCCDLSRKMSPDKVFCCKPNGADCRNSKQCCQGVCSAGLCQNVVVQLPPTCAEYGQTCTTTADCCPLPDGTTTPCSGGLCRFP